MSIGALDMFVGADIAVEVDIAAVVGRSVVDMPAVDDIVVVHMFVVGDIVVVSMAAALHNGPNWSPANSSVAYSLHWTIAAEVWLGSSVSVRSLCLWMGRWRTPYLLAKWALFPFHPFEPSVGRWLAFPAHLGLLCL